MRYISVCSGIEAASVAWQPLGWEAVAFAEIEPFPSAVLKYHYPDVPNLGDISQVDWSKYAGTIDVIVGGTPCQSFSIAGKREGMDGASGLVREYFRLLSECKPRWFVWENVPGAFSSNGGDDWLFILREWHERGYNVSYRVLDAQYAGVPQRRRRVFAVGYLGDWRPPAKVLFEQYSLQRHPAPSRKTGKADPGSVANGAGKTSHWSGGPHPALSQSHNTGGIGMSDQEIFSQGGAGLVAGCVSSKWAKGTGGPAGDECYNLVCTQYGDKAGALRARYDSSPCADNGQNIVAITETGQGFWTQTDIAGTLRVGGDSPSTPSNVIFPEVRRLTPTECERLQGFPDGWTDITYKGKPAPDGARYRALGNSMAVPCMAWIGRRIQMVEDGEL